MSHYARGALISEVQPPRSDWDAFGLYGSHSAYWLSREPCFTPSQLEDLDLEYTPEHHLPFAISHTGVFRPRHGRPDPAAGRHGINPRRPGRKPTRARAKLAGRPPGNLKRTGNY